MTIRKALIGTLFLTSLLWGANPGKRPPPKRRPSPPLTGPKSVQMFQGGTDHCWIAVYPPPSYIDGQRIPDRTRVRIKVYRSLDGGKTYQSKGVAILSGGHGYVGQGEENARIKRWIDLKLQTPVDNKKPYTVWLGASAVVNQYDEVR